MKLEEKPEENMQINYMIRLVMLKLNNKINIIINTYLKYF